MSIIIRCYNRDNQEKEYRVEENKPSTVYTLSTLIISTILAGGSIALYYTENKESLLRLVASIVMSFAPNVYFTKDSCDKIRDLSRPSKEYLSFRIIKVGSAFLLGAIATAPQVLAEYIETKSSFNTMLQLCSFPTNFVGMYGFLAGLTNPFSSLFRKHEPLIQLSKVERKLMKQAQRSLLLNLLRADPKVRSAYKDYLLLKKYVNVNLESADTKLAPVWIPASKSSLVTRLYFALQALEQGKDVTTTDKVLFYGSKTVSKTLGLGFSFLLVISTLGLLANVRRNLFDFENGEVEFMRLASPWDWIAASFLMLPMAYFSILGGFEVANDIVGSALTWAISRYFPRLLEATLGNNIMRAWLAIGVIISALCGWASGANDRTLFEKYFPNFQLPGPLFAWLNKDNLTELTEISAAGFNIIYFLLFATLLGIRGFYRNFGFSEERAIINSQDSYNQLVTDVESLTPEECAYLLQTLNTIAVNNNDTRIDLSTSVTTNNQRATETSPLLQESPAQSEQAANLIVPLTIQKAVGNQVANLIAHSGIFVRKHNSERLEKPGLAPTVNVFGSQNSAQQLILSEPEEVIDEHTSPIKNAESLAKSQARKDSRCTIL